MADWTIIRRENIKLIMDGHSTVLYLDRIESFDIVCAYCMEIEKYSA